MVRIEKEKRKRKKEKGKGVASVVSVENPKLPDNKRLNSFGNLGFLSTLPTP
jgi:hypothetical protein